MASYLDETYQYAPYVETAPLEAMAKVGMAKQQAFDQGVQKVQGWIDSIAALPTAREADANYIQARLNELGTQLKKMVGADWSNQQLVGAVGGAASNLARDKNVTAAVASANQIQEGIKAADAGKAKGDGPENTDLFYDQVNEFTKSTELGRAFNQKYQPYLDVEKHAREVFNNALKADGISWDQVFETDEQGRALVDPNTGKRIFSEKMTRLEREGLFPPKVRATLNQIFADPRVNQQLEITGRYVYKPLTGESLKEKVASQQQKALLDYDNTITTLTYQMNNLAKTDLERKNLEEAIDAAKKNRAKMAGYYQNLLENVDVNPVGVRSNLYKNEIKDQFNTMYSWTKEKYQALENPAMTVALKLQEMAAKREEFIEKTKYDYAALRSLDKYRDVMGKAATLRALKSGSGDGDSTTTIDLDGDGYPDSPQDLGMGDVTEGDKPANVTNFGLLSNDVDNGAMAYDAATTELIFEGLYSNNPSIVAELKRYTSAGVPELEAMKTLLKKEAQKNNMSDQEFRAISAEKVASDFNALSPAEKRTKSLMANLVSNYNSSKKQFNTLGVILDDVENASGYKKFNREEATRQLNVKPQTINLYGVNYNLSPEDFYDVATYLRGTKYAIGNNKHAAEEAKKASTRLEKRGLTPVKDYLEVHYGPSLTPDPVGGLLSRIPQISRFISDKDYELFQGGKLPKEEEWSQVWGLYNYLNTPEYVESAERREKAAESRYTVPPTARQPLTSKEKPAQNKSIITKVSNIAAAYNSPQAQNNSPTFKAFMKGLDEAKKRTNWADRYNFVAEVIVDNSGNTVPRVVLNDGVKEIGAMEIREDEAASIDVDVNNLFWPSETRTLRSLLESPSRLHQSSEGPVDQKSTYRNNDVWQSTQDFPSLNGSKFNVGVNYKMKGKVFYPYLYVSDGQKEVLLNLSPGDNLYKVEQSVKTLMNPNSLQTILSKY